MQFLTDLYAVKSHPKRSTRTRGAGTGVSGGQMTSPRPGNSHGNLTPRFFLLEIFSGTHPHGIYIIIIIILYSETTSIGLLFVIIYNRFVDF